jgi:RHS repeat-associated protein
MNQVKVESMRYTPYGEMTITRGGSGQATDPLGQHWSYTGRFYDEESGLYNYRARVYDPLRGRFLQRDPLSYAPGPNPYEYVASSPANASDPLGQAAIWWPPWWPPPPPPKRHTRVDLADVHVYQTRVIGYIYDSGAAANAPPPALEPPRPQPPKPQPPSSEPKPYSRTERGCQRGPSFAMRSSALARRAFASAIAAVR